MSTHLFDPPGGSEYDLYKVSDSEKNIQDIFIAEILRKMADPELEGLVIRK